MEARAKLLGHPIHQMLIVFPLGLLTTSVVFDVVYWMTRDVQWSLVAYWLIAAGIVGGLLAAPFGFLDWLKIPRGTRARRVGAAHGLGNVLVLGLFAASWLVRDALPLRPDTLSLLLSIAGVALSGVTAWLGGELVDRLGVGVDDGAHLDAPSSLSGRPASAPAHGD